MDAGIVDSAGNVFADLGFPPEEAAILQMRAELMAELRKFLKAKKLTQVKAAEIFGISQSRVSDLARGKWEKFSLEMLIILSTKAGMHVTLKTAAWRGLPIVDRFASHGSRKRRAGTPKASRVEVG